MHKFVSNYLKGVTISTIVLPAGTVVTDETNGKLYVHDGITPGGVQLTGATGGNIIASLGYTPVNKAGDAMLGLFQEVATNAITAVGTTQGAAVALTAQINNVTTSTATSKTFNGVKLPASVAGLEIELINSSANPIQVYGASTDTINGVATAIGVTQPPNSVVEYSCTAAGTWYAEGLGVGFAGSMFTESTQDNIVCQTGRTAALASAQLYAQTNRVTTVTTPLDGVVLPTSAAGIEMIIINASTKAMTVYGFGSDTIDGNSATVGVTQMSGSLTIYTSATAGAWFTNGLGTGYSGSLQTLSFFDGLTATGSNQSGALALTTLLSRVSTVASGTGVLLPASAPGLSITINNTGLNVLQVYGAGTDTINGVATANGVQQMINSIVTYVCSAAGAWFATGLGNGYSTSYATLSTITGLVAHAGGGQGSATPLTAMINNVTTVATAGNSLILPVNTLGMSITVCNNGGSLAMNVFPDSGGNINGLGANVALSVANATIVIFYCIATNVWMTK
jgi:hypothetical protein